MQHLPPPDAVAVPAEDTAAKDPAAVWFHYVSLKILIVVLLVVVLLFCCWSSWGCHPKKLTERRCCGCHCGGCHLPSPSFLPSKNLLYQILVLLLTDKASFFLASLVPSFLHSFLPSFLPFLPYFLSSFLPSFLPSFIPCFLPSLLSGFYFSWCKVRFFGASPLRHW